jgi:hypothetical protein
LKPPELVLEIDIGELLAVVVAHDKAGGLFARQSKAAGSGEGRDRVAYRTAYPTF